MARDARLIVFRLCRAALLGLAGLVAPAIAAKVPRIGALRAPVSPTCISSPFGPRVLPGKPLAGTFHNGVDLAAPLGAPVHAVAPGTLLRVLRYGPGGLQLLVQHPGFVGIYAHLGGVAASIAEGKRRLTAGEKLGVVGLTGVAYGTHLFFGMRVDGRAIDPAPYLDIGPCKAGSGAGGEGERDGVR